jgi:hypothetical protein
VVSERYIVAKRLELSPGRKTWSSMPPEQMMSTPPLLLKDPEEVWLPELERPTERGVWEPL